MTRMGRRALALGLAGLLGGSVSAARIDASPGDAVTSGSGGETWAAIAWPFLLDQWGTGQAFACRGAGCAPNAQLLVRQKSGFCNCTNGIADDEEVDRLADFDLLGRHVVPLGPGRPITVGDIAGRMRAFDVESPQGAVRRAVVVAIGRDCDAVVATLMSDGDPAAAREAAMGASVGAKMVAALP